MTIASYSDLQTAAANWLTRDDLTSNILDFITLFEAEANRKVRVRQMMITSVTTPSTGQFSLPADYLTWKNVRWNGSPFYDLQYVDWEQFSNLYPDAPSANPKVFTIVGTTDGLGAVKITPIDSTTVNFTYYQKITNLSTSNTVNWLLTAHPDLYLAGTLTEGFAFVKDWDNAGVWKQRRDDLIGEVNLLDQKTRGPAGIRPIGATP